MKIALTLLGALLFLFIYWKKLKEDYSSNIIFTSAIYVILGIGVFEAVSSRFLPIWWFWMDMLGVLLGFGIAILKYKLRIYETLEALIVSLIPWLSFVFLANSIQTSDTASLFVFASILLLLPVFYFFDARYKRFVWYKSGRIGFSGLITAGVFFLLRAFVAVFFGNVLSFVGTVDTLLSAVLAFSAFLAVFTRARTAT
jgi:hypothetical protein